jgi:DNA-binding NtrC family response regulator
MTTPRMLCVAESVWVLDELRRVLEIAGYEVVSASTGKHALRIVTHESVDGIVLSFDMKAPDGRALRNQIGHVHPEVPMLLFSDVEEIRDMPLHVFRAYLDNPQETELALVE